MALELFAHQRRGIERLTERPRYYLAWDMGTAKTVTTLAAIEKIGGRTLVLCPKSVRYPAWVGDSQHFPSLKVKVVEGSRPARHRIIADQSADVLVTNYDTFRSDWEKYVGIHRMVCDEMSKAKNYDSQTTDKLYRVAKHAESVWGLCGTPDPNGAHEWVPQLMIISEKVFDGRGYWAIMGKYFYRVDKQRRDGRTFPVWKQSEQQTREFQDAIRPWVWSMKKHECMSLPPISDMVHHVELSPAERDVYDAAQEELQLRLKDRTITLDPNAATMKVRQIVGGNVLGDGQSNHVGTSKLDVLEEILDNLGHDEPVVIWAEFREEINRIVAMIGNRGELVDRIDGTSSHRSGETVRRFQAGEIKRLVCHPASAGHGLTLTAACYAIYYSLSFSAEQHQQSRDRINRAGQTRPCTFVYLLCPETIDTAMYGVQRQKKKASDAIAEALKLPREQVPASIH